ncbi:GNAT family N-acetyltransferase [Halobacillus trueperi]|uniref:N-acetyltransferase n=1 Tax=Halobacillus trueperi TaxID=156205 RepID=A0A3E0J595_9BACI|nr:GNAT family N-acetyltransferase [Halobacillus trueperi]REJ07967.1 N-acetyltransferase [Halobacillus trueperi]
MFQDSGKENLLREDFLEEVEKKYGELYKRKKAIHYVIEDKNKIIACAGAFIKEDLPYCFYEQSEYGFIGDVYVDHKFRRKGYAQALTNKTIDWFSKKGIQTVRLLASNDAKELYKSFGFEQTDQMVLNIRSK